MYIHSSTCLQLSCLAFFDSFPNASELLKLGWPKLEFSFYGIGGSCSAKGEVSSHQCPCDRMFDPISCNSLLFSCSPTQLHMGTQWSCNKLFIVCCARKHWTISWGQQHDASLSSAKYPHYRHNTKAHKHLNSKPNRVYYKKEKTQQISLA